jgi:hypothetical protein
VVCRIAGCRQPVDPGHRLGEGYAGFPRRSRELARGILLPLGYGLVGFHFGPTQADPVDLSGLDSLVFWFKGRGTVRVEFVADTGGGVASHALVLAPDTVWTRHAVTAAALAPIDAGRSWAVDSKRVRFLQFIVFQAAEFRLDDLRYYGKARP